MTLISRTRTPSRSRTRTIAALAAVAALVPVAVDAARAAPAPQPVRAIERALLTEVNRVRASEGLRPLANTATLQQPARAHSRWLLKRGLLVHEGPGGAPFWTRLVKAGFPRNRPMSENLAQLDGCAPGAARTTVRMWMASPPHRANLLDRRLRRAGLGAARSASCTLVVTADFGG